jgi:hypothetical protein
MTRIRAIAVGLALASGLAAFAASAAATHLIIRNVKTFSGGVATGSLSEQPFATTKGY